jgi:hypothetical protein
MTVILACGAALVLAILILVFSLARTAKGDAYEQQAKDDEQMAALMEHRLSVEMEHDLFATK